MGAGQGALKNVRHRYEEPKCGFLFDLVTTVYVGTGSLLEPSFGAQPQLPVPPWTYCKCVWSHTCRGPPTSSSFLQRYHTGPASGSGTVCPCLGGFGHGVYRCRLSHLLSQISVTMLRRGVITQSVCKNVTLYLNQAGLSPASSAQTPADPLPTKPLLLMLPWLGSRPHAVAKYCETYFRLGFDVLMVQSNVTDFLWPRWGLETTERLLDLLHTDRFVSRPLLVHAFSIGCYTFSQMLVHVSQNPEKYEAFPGRIKGHVYDSAVVGSVEKMAKGLGITVFPHCEKLVTKASLLYFSAFKRQTVDHFNRGIEVFKSTPVRAPVLFFFCENDPLSDHLAVEEVLDLWRKRGMDVTGKSWEDSTHAGHLRRHPQEYQLVLDNFLYSLKLSALQSRM